ncbi:MAG: putative capsular polysaccharide synthesis family protein [Bacteroidales bacterium]|nr:putative capsular polysaccharide synthesis family protein [Bacteroidales bacterium]
MFEFFKIDKDLTIYRKNDVIIFGASGAGLKVKHLLEQYGIEVAAFTDNNVNKVGENIEGVKVISVEECVEHVQNKPTIIQIGSTYEKEIVKQLKNQGINEFVWYSEFLIRIQELSKFIFFLREPEINKLFDEIQWGRRCFSLAGESATMFIQEYQYTNTVRLMLSAAKTGNCTIQNSVRNKEKSILPIVHFCSEISTFIQKFSGGYSVKLIIGVRDPIKQNISMMYQALAMGDPGWCAYYDLDAYWEGGGDVKKIFNEYVIKSDKDCYFTKYKDIKKGDGLVQHFFEQEIEPFLGIDIYQYPFDKENGYSIYHISDKLDIMIYQLEKLNSLEAEVGDFLEIEDFELVKDNDSADKWYKESYQNVIKNMPIDKQYYEECYSGKYINHFYSAEDIDKFKAQWKVEEN